MARAGWTWLSVWMDAYFWIYLILAELTEPGWPWLALAGPGWPWLALAGHVWAWLEMDVDEWIDGCGWTWLHGQPGHGRGWLSWPVQIWQVQILLDLAGHVSHSWTCLTMHGPSWQWLANRTSMWMDMARHGWVCLDLAGHSWTWLTLCGWSSRTSKSCDGKMLQALGGLGWPWLTRLELTACGWSRWLWLDVAGHCWTWAWMHGWMDVAAPGCTWLHLAGQLAMSWLDVAGPGWMWLV